MAWYFDQSGTLADITTAVAAMTGEGVVEQNIIDTYVIPQINTIIAQAPAGTTAIRVIAHGRGTDFVYENSVRAEAVKLDHVGQIIGPP